MKNWNSTLPPKILIEDMTTLNYVTAATYSSFKGNKILSSDGQNSFSQDNHYTSGLDKFDSGK